VYLEKYSNQLSLKLLWTVINQLQPKTPASLVIELQTNILAETSNAAKYFPAQTEIYLIRKSTTPGPNQEGKINYYSSEMSPVANF
jgi:hypothetical protein